MGGVLPRKFGGLFKPKAKLSKTAHQKLRESLKIFDFSSDSGSEGEEEGVAVKKPTKPKAPPSIEMNAESVKVKGENGTGKVKGGSSTVKQQGNTNYRYTCTCIYMHVHRIIHMHVHTMYMYMYIVYMCMHRYMCIV